MFLETTLSNTARLALRVPLDFNLEGGLKLEMRDQNITTYTYLQDLNGKLRFFGETIGYGLPYSTEFTSPMKDSFHGSLPQADPNGLFSPASAEGTWILMKDPNGTELSPVYIEPRITVAKFKLPANCVEN